jgi:hypothetical protein
MRIFLALALLAFPATAQVTFDNVTIDNVTVSAAAGGTTPPTCSGGSWSESYDGTGYDLSDWAGNEFGGNTYDEDNSTRTETGFSGNSLNFAIPSAGANSYSFHDPSNIDPTFSAISLYVDTEALDNSERQSVWYFSKTFSSDAYVCTNLYKTAGGQLQLEFAYGLDCRTGTGTMLASTYDIAVDTVYIIQMEADDNTTNDTVGWKVWDCGSDGETGCDGGTPDQEYRNTSAGDVVWNSGDQRHLVGIRSSVAGSDEYDAYIGFVETGTSAPCS